MPTLAADTSADDTEALLRQAEEALAGRDVFAASKAFSAAADLSPDPAVAGRATQFNYGVGMDAMAEQTARRWATLAPGNPLPHELLGRLKLRRHAVDEAIPDLLAALGTAEPRRDEVYLALASDLSTEDNGRLVTRALARLTALDSLSPGLQLALGTAALRSGDFELALGAGTAAGLDAPEWPEAQLLIARALAALGRKAEALAKIQTLMAGKPNPMIALECARLLADAGEPDQAREALAALVVQHGEQPEISRTLAFMDLAAGDLDAADQRLQTLDDAGSLRFEAFYFRGQIAAQRGDVEQARRLYGRISSGPYLVPAQIATAESLMRADAGDDALDVLTRFGRDHPAQAFDVLEYRAHLLQRLDRPEEALSIYTEALRYKPAAIAILLSRAVLLEQQGRLKEAIEDTETALRIAPADPAVLNAMGYILANRTRHTRRAWHLVRTAYEQQPASAPIQDSVGWTLFKLGRSDEARSHLEEALASMPDPEIAGHLAEVYWQLGERARAEELLQAMAKDHPDSKPLRDTAERLRR